ncbi:hypothetical protein P7K49_030710, partial [Saguinus oedipus]
TQGAQCSQAPRWVSCRALPTPAGPTPGAYLSSGAATHQTPRPDHHGLPCL